MVCIASFRAIAVLYNPGFTPSEFLDIGAPILIGMYHQITEGAEVFPLPDSLGVGGTRSEASRFFIGDFAGQIGHDPGISTVDSCT